MKSFFYFILSIVLSTSVSAQHEYTAYIFLAEECPVCIYMVNTLKKQSIEFKDKVKFIAVFPHIKSSSNSAKSFLKKYELGNFDYVVDTNRDITNKYNATVTPEVVLINSNEEVLYQGRINNSFASPGRMRHGKVKEELHLVISEVIKGNSIPKPWPDPIGCYITKR